MSKIEPSRLSDGAAQLEYRMTAFERFGTECHAFAINSAPVSELAWRDGAEALNPNFAPTAQIQGE